MALVNCPNCGKQVNNITGNCLYCGADLNKSATPMEESTTVVSEASVAKESEQSVEQTPVPEDTKVFAPVQPTVAPQGYAQVQPVAAPQGYAPVQPVAAPQGYAPIQPTVAPQPYAPVNQAMQPEPDRVSKKMEKKALKEAKKEAKKMTGGEKKKTSPVAIVLMIIMIVILLGGLGFFGYFIYKQQTGDDPIIFNGLINFTRYFHII